MINQFFFVLYLVFLQEVEEQPANLNYDDIFQDKANSWGGVRPILQIQTLCSKTGKGVPIGLFVVTGWILRNGHVKKIVDIINNVSWFFLFVLMKMKLFIKKYILKQWFDAFKCLAVIKKYCYYIFLNKMQRKIHVLPPVWCKVFI